MQSEYLDLPQHSGSLSSLHKCLCLQGLRPERDFTLLYLEKSYRVVFLGQPPTDDLRKQITAMWFLSN